MSSGFFRGPFVRGSCGSDFLESCHSGEVKYEAVLAKIIQNHILDFTLPETNIAPENGWLVYYFPIGIVYFQGRTVSFRECNTKCRLNRSLRSRH